MRFLVALTLLATAYGSIPNECEWGDSYTCSSLATAHKCGTFQHCMDDVWKNAELQKDTTDVCQFCEAIIKDVRDFIDDKNNQEEVKTFLTNACNVIPDEALANLCKTSVTEEFDELIKMIDSELDPATICSCMGLCSGFKKAVLQHKKSALKEGTNGCEFCEAIIKDIRAFVDDKNNQEQIKDMLKTVCKLISDQEISSLCMTAVDDEIDTLIQMIDSELDPAEVCKEMQLCTAKKQTVKVQADPMCPECTKFFMEVKSKLSDATTEKEIKQLIEENLCALMGNYKDVCQLAVDTYLPEILQMLSTDVDPSMICSALGFCPSTPEARMLLAKLRLQSSQLHGAAQAGRVGGEEECLLCKTVLTELQNLDRNEEMQKEVEDFIKKNLCGAMGTLQSVCETTVDEYGPELFELLVSELDPNTRCAALGFCSAKSVEAVLRAAVPKSAPPKVPQSKVTSPAVADPSTQCVLCEFVIQTIDKQLGDNATEEEIIKALDEVCDVLPDTIKESCEQFVATYGPTVIALLLQELDPQEVCTKLGLCTATVDASPQCVLCEFVMTQIDQILNNNKTEAEIIAALDKVCEVLPSSVKQDCLDFVNTYGPAVIALLEQELEPSEICAILGLCPQQEKLLLQKASYVSDEECGICETIIQYLDSLIEENATIAEIEQTLEKVCNFLPSTLKQQCDQFVEQYGPALIQMLASDLDPKEICTKLGLCSQSHEESNSVVMEKIVPAKVHMLGENKCTQGPAFWCLNMDNALKCKAVEHCKLKVWN